VGRHIFSAHIFGRFSLSAKNPKSHFRRQKFWCIPNEKTQITNNRKKIQMFFFRYILSRDAPLYRPIKAVIITIDHRPFDHCLKTANDQGRLFPVNQEGAEKRVQTATHTYCV